MDPRIWSIGGIVVLVLVFLAGGKWGGSLAARTPILNTLP